MSARDPRLRINPEHLNRWIDDAFVEETCAFVAARHDCADFRVATLLLLRYGAELPPRWRERIDATLLGFAYGMDEPGTDEMCQWSENHQALFAVEEMLAGQLHPDARFGNLDYTGRERCARGAARLQRWMGERFRFGFSEWCSNTYYEEDVCAMALASEFADDQALAQRARIVLDLLLLDMALHSFKGAFVGTSGRCYEEQKKHPDGADVRDVMTHAFGTGDDDPDLRRLSAVFALAARYHTPPVLRAIASLETDAVIRESTGLDTGEVARHFADPLDPDTAGAYLWAAEAFTHPDGIRATMRAYRRWGMESNRFLAPLAPFARLAELPLVGDRALPGIVRALRPVTQGLALQRANIYAYRTPAFHLSSAQSYHPGGFGDQQHLWQASLPGGLTMFATHPATAPFGEDVRNATPGAWVGNGRNPDIGQERGQLVALYDTRGRPGYLERERQRRTHLWLPTAELDHFVLGPDWLAGQAGDAFVGVRGLRPFELVSADELVQHGDVTGYGVTLTSTLDFASFEDFRAFVASTRLRYERHRLTFSIGQGELQVRWRRGLWIDGVHRPHDFPRYATPWVNAEREPERIVVECAGERLVLDWAAGTRELSRNAV